MARSSRTTRNLGSVSSVCFSEFVYGLDLWASGMGRTNERIGRIQETYVAHATSSWLESLERSLAQMKDYQVCQSYMSNRASLTIKQTARKKLENRRLAYDTSLKKMQKAKGEDFRVEEELRIQKAKYEETSEEVYRRMQDVGQRLSSSRTQVAHNFYSRSKRQRPIVSSVWGHSLMLS